MVSNVDIAATVFDLTEATVPDEYVLDGVSYLDDVVATLNEPDTDLQESCRYRYIDHHMSHSIVSGQYQYIYRVTDEVDQAKGVDEMYPFCYDTEQLYDIIADPDQKVNLINDITKDLQQTVALFETKMRAYLDDVCPIDGPNACDMPYLRYELDEPSATAPAYAFTTPSAWGGPVSPDSPDAPEPTSCSDMECCSDDDCTKRKKPSCNAGVCAAAPPCEFECCSDNECGRKEMCLEDNTCGTPVSSGDGDGSCSSDSDCGRKEECKEGVCATKERNSGGGGRGGGGGGGRGGGRNGDAQMWVEGSMTPMPVQINEYLLLLMASVALVCLGLVWKCSVHFMAQKRLEEREQEADCKYGSV